MVGDRIKLLRTERNMTQEELAKAFSISTSTVGMYEQNRRTPDIETVIKISSFFNVSTDYLLDIPGKELNEKNMQEINISKSEEQFLVMFRKLDNDYKDIVIGELKKCAKMQEQEYTLNKKDSPQKKQA